MLRKLRLWQKKDGFPIKKGVGEKGFYNGDLIVTNKFHKTNIGGCNKLIEITWNNVKIEVTYWSKM